MLYKYLLSNGSFQNSLIKELRVLSPLLACGGSGLSSVEDARILARYNEGTCSHVPLVKCCQLVTNHDLTNDMTKPHKPKKTKSKNGKKGGKVAAEVAGSESKSADVVEVTDVCDSAAEPDSSSDNVNSAASDAVDAPLEDNTSSVLPPSAGAKPGNIHEKKRKTTRKKLKLKKQETIHHGSLAKSLSKLQITHNDTKPTKPHVSTGGRTRSYSSRSSTTGTTSTRCKTLADIVQHIKSGMVKNVIVMAGAGISTSSGIPDFRTPGTGLYDNLQRYNIPYATAVFDLDYFNSNPRPFFELAKELYPNGKYLPNEAHYFVKVLHDKGFLQRIYTQNIDGLERAAGVPPHKLVEAHGTFETASCTTCRKKYSGDEIKAKIFNNKIPRCDTALCWGVVKPDIVFFGEDLPQRFYYYVKDFPLCDLLIIMGTSLEVEPFASLINSVRPNTPRLLINRDRVGPFRKCRRPGDVAVTGDISEIVTSLTAQLGWLDRLDAAIGEHVALLIDTDKERTVRDTGAAATAPSEPAPGGKQRGAASSRADSGISSASSELSLGHHGNQTLQRPLPALAQPPPHVKRYHTGALPQIEAEAKGEKGDSWRSLVARVAQFRWQIGGVIAFCAFRYYLTTLDTA